MKWLMMSDRKNIERPIYIHIMCNGGELDIMFALYDLIKNMRRPVVTINEGRCHSAAFIVFLAGHSRLMRKYAQFVAHEGSAGISGSHREVQQATEAYKKNVEDMRDIIAAETKITKEQLKEHFDREQDWYIDYEQAKEFGILKEGSVEYFANSGHGNACLGKVGDMKLTLPGYAEV